MNSYLLENRDRNHFSGYLYKQRGIKAGEGWNMLPVNLLPILSSWIRLTLSDQESQETGEEWKINNNNNKKI